MVTDSTRPRVGHCSVEDQPGSGRTRTRPAAGGPEACDWTVPSTAAEAEPADRVPEVLEPAMPRSSDHEP